MGRLAISVLLQALKAILQVGPFQWGWIIGPSAISKLPEGFSQNETDIGRWRAAIQAGHLATGRGHGLADDDRERARIIEDLMCAFRADLGGTGDRYADELALLRPFTTDGLVEQGRDHIVLTPKGRPFVRLVASVFDRFRADVEEAFSKAV